MAIKTYRLGHDRNSLVIETYNRIGICNHTNCPNKSVQELYITQPDGNALCIRCCIHIHGRIWMNKNGN